MKTLNSLLKIIRFSLALFLIIPITIIALIMDTLKYLLYMIYFMIIFNRVPPWKELIPGPNPEYIENFVKEFKEKLYPKF